MSDDKLIVSVRESSHAPIENVEIPANPNGQMTVKHVLAHIARYHGAKTYEGKQLLLDGVKEAEMGTVLAPGQHTIFVGEDIEGGPRS